MQRHVFLAGFCGLILLLGKLLTTPDFYLVNVLNLYQCSLFIIDQGNQLQHYFVLSIYNPLVKYMPGVLKNKDFFSGCHYLFIKLFCDRQRRLYIIRTLDEVNRDLKR